jgi:hypothetical protein
MTCLVLSRLNAQELAEMIKSKSSNELEKFAVVDVRDSDFVVGLML